MSTDRVNTGPRLAAIATGVGISGFVFCFFLSGDLALRRPLPPDAARSYMSLIHIKSAEVYGTHFEQLAATYRPFAL